MSPRDRSLWLALNRRASALSPQLARELLDAYRVIRDSLTDAELTQLIQSGELSAIIDDALLDRAFLPLREKVVAGIRKSFEATTRSELPRQGKIDGEVAVAFDTLNPVVIQAVRKLDSEVIQTLKSDVRDTVRAFVENGLRDGRGPRDIARDIRGTLGMSPTQTVNLAKYEAKLRAMKNPPSDAQIEKMVNAYRKRAIALNADTNARTIALDSQKLGQRLSWRDGIDKGLITGTLMKRWVGVKDDRERPEHLAMEGETAAFEGAFSNGEVTPGESTYNCRCVAVMFVERAA